MLTRSTQPGRRSFLRRSWQIGVLGLSTCWLGLREAFGATDPRPEFAASGIADILNFYFGITESSDDASIEISIPLVVPHQHLVPFRISAPGAEKIAVLTDANPEPLILTVEQIQNGSGVVVGRARLERSGHIACFALRNGVVGKSVRKVNIAGSWREVAQ